MVALLLRVISTLGTIVTAASVVASAGAAGKTALWILILLSFVVMVLDIIKYLKNEPRRYPPQSPKIHEYLCRWMKRGGKTVIFSRDLSWADADSEASKIMEEKARRGELIVFVSNRTALTRRLQSSGAQIFMHASNFSPHSRFTIIDYEKVGARVAIGQIKKDRHVIREYDEQDASELALANDLVKLAMAKQTKSKR